MNQQSIQRQFNIQLKIPTRSAKDMQRFVSPRLTTLIFTAIFLLGPIIMMHCPGQGGG